MDSLLCSVRPIAFTPVYFGNAQLRALNDGTERDRGRNAR